MHTAPSHVVDTPWHNTGTIDSFDRWADQVAQSYTTLTVTPTGDSGPFAGAIAARHLGPETTVSHITAVPQKVRRRRQDIRTSPCEALFVNFQIAGDCKVSQAGLDTVQRPGSIMLLDARRPFTMQFDQPFRQYCLHLPLAHLSRAGPDVANAAGRVMKPDQTGATHLFSAVAGAAPAHLTDLIAALESCYAHNQVARLSDAHLALMQRYVRRHHAAREISVQTVARHFRVSPRYVHRLFARTGASFGHYLRDVRLTAARRLIQADPSLRVAEVGTACGFATASHFSRSFKAAFGAAPSAMVQPLRSNRSA